MRRSQAGEWSVPGGFAIAAFLLYLLPGLVGEYGPFIDELYYVACAERLAWGYVDQPPLSLAVLRVARAVLGEGLVALRLPAALLGACVVFGVGLLARRLGAGRFGQAIACGAMLTASVFQIIFGYYSMNSIEMLLWFACGWLLLEIERRRDGRLWLLFGAVAGLGLLNKHTMVLFGLGLGIGLLATPARRHLSRGWIWFGAGIALLVVAPNLLWQAAHGWPSLEFYRNAHSEKVLLAPPHQVLLLQVLFLNPGTLPVWAAGIVWFLRHRAPLDLRHLGVLALVLLGVVAVGRESRPDRIAGLFPLLFAAGGVAWETLVRRPRWRVGRIALPACLMVTGVLFLPLTVPIASPPALVAYLEFLHFQPQIERGAGKRTPLPQWFADRLGWQQLVDDVAAARDKLSPEERRQALYFAPSYGQAGALEWLGRERGLRPVYCTHNSWFLWGPPPDPVEVAIVLGEDAAYLGSLFEEVELAGIHDCEWCMPWRDEMPVWIVRRARVRLADRWPEWKHFE